MSFQPINRMSVLIEHSLADEDQIKRLRQLAELVVSLTPADGISLATLRRLQEAARRALERDG